MVIQKDFVLLPEMVPVVHARLETDIEVRAGDNGGYFLENA